MMRKIYCKQKTKDITLKINYKRVRLNKRLIYPGHYGIYQAIMDFTRPLWVSHYKLFFTCHKA